ncbi:MAG: ornithine cyclodeaminase family protein [Thermoleophilaceae bacterium]|nr:ornithine cyclodeaminase family protein [Thermoleophilaceae bacterium]
MRVLTAADVEGALDADELVESLAGAFAQLSAGQASMPQRIAVEVPERRGSVLLMGAHLEGRSSLTTKLVSLFPDNPRGGPPTHQAAILVFDAATGTPTALMDGTSVTELRTAAGSRLATRLLARPNASVLAIFGTGVQARAHARALARERSWREVRIAGRDSDAAERVAAALRDEIAAPVTAAGSFPAALDGADVVCAATAATEPVVRREWLSPGVHVNSVGYTTAGREVDADTVRDAVVVVESRAAALAESNDIRWAIRDGVPEQEAVHAELGEVVAGTRPGRTTADQITLYKSLGVAAEDDAAAGLVLAAAEREGIGTMVDL